MKRDYETETALRPYYEELFAAICIQAAKDYTWARDELKVWSDNRLAAYYVSECEGFFRSEWFHRLAPGYDGEVFIEQLRKTTYKKLMKKIK